MATLDVTVHVGDSHGRLISNAETDARDEWTVVALGKTDDAENVHVRVVDEERLLIEAGRSAATPLLLVSRHGSTFTDEVEAHRRLVAELVDGGPARDLLGLSGASSVLVEPTDASQSTPGGATEPARRRFFSRYVDTY
ncbi:hypothetical protein [Prescottella equi]|uniref:hypothetical protein n=1 Tax=Rhodococcus hoagii TaxID=43767 RepID=UPI00111BD614|nr:hypothetical protein [Prescottella equi]